MFELLSRCYHYASWCIQSLCRLVQPVLRGRSIELDVGTISPQGFRLSLLEDPLCLSTWTPHRDTPVLIRYVNTDSTERVITEHVMSGAHVSLLRLLALRLSPTIRLSLHNLLRLGDR